MHLRSIAIIGLLFLALLPVANAEGLLGTYYDQNSQQRQYFTGNTVVQVDPVINFDWGNGVPTTGIGADDFSIRWEGEILMPNWNGGATRSIGFRTRSDDGVRLYIDINQDGDFNDVNETVINNWTDHGPTNNDQYINLTRNQRYPVLLEFYERGGGAVIELSWDLPGGGANWAIIPTDNLFPPPRVIAVSNSSDSINPCGDPRSVVITWSTAMQSGGANGADNAANFSISGGPAISSATLSGDGLTTTLTLASDLVNATDYDLVASGVRSSSGLNLSPNPTTYPFTANVGVLTAGGLAASYYPQLNFGGTAVERIDSAIAFDWGTGNPGIPGFPASQFSVRWEGFITIPANYNGEIVTNSSDGIRVWIDNTLIIDDWNDHAVSENRVAAGLTAGQTYSLRVEFYDNTNTAAINLGYRTDTCTQYFWIWCIAWADANFQSADFSYCDRGQSLGGFLIGVAPGTASTCAPLNVSISAQDGGGNPLTAWTGTVALETIPIGTTHGDWSVVSATSPVNDPTADDGQANYTFVSGDNGAVTLALSNAHADDLQIRVTDVLTAVSSQTGTISFRDNAFVIAGTDTPPLDDVPVAGRPHPVEISMMRRETPGDPSSDCAVAPGYTGAKNLKAWITRDGVDPNGAAPEIGASGNLPNATPGGNNVALTFNNGLATFDLDTTDVGKYTLHLVDDSRDFANAVDIGGMTNMLTVRPYAISVRTAENGAGPADAVLTSAGTPFSAELVGVLWETGDAANGVPTTNDIRTGTLDDNAPAASFANDVSISAVLNQPAAGVLGAFPNQDVLSTDFAGGTATYNNFRYDEVGSVYLDAASADYLGTPAADITGGSQSVGRFTPAYLETEVEEHGCAASFTYSAQAIPQLNVTAYNAQGAVTRNYFWTGAAGTSFSKNIVLTDANGTLAGNFSTGAISQLDLSGGDTCTGGDGNCSGTGTTVITNEAFTLDDPQTVAGDITIRATDSDGVNSAGHEDSTTIHSGRARLIEKVVPSIVDAEQLLLIETWQDAGGGTFQWEINTTDTCTDGLVNMASFTLSGAAAGNTSVTGFTYTAGIGTVTLAAPGKGNEGVVDVTADAPGWLEFDWGSGVADPEAAVSFESLFQAEDGFIDRREVIGN